MRNIKYLLVFSIWVLALFPGFLSANKTAGNLPEPDKTISIPENIPELNKNLNIEKKSDSPQKEKISINWLNNIDAAFADAMNQFRPILILFSSAECPWCIKLKNTTLNDTEVKSLLSEFITVEINVAQDRKTPALFGITGIPVIVLTNSNGRELLRAEGYLSTQQLLSMLNSVLNKKVLASKHTEMSKLLYLLRDNKMKKENWRELMLSLGKYPNHSNEVFTLIRNYKNLTVKTFIELLSDPVLTVRLGALEVLEELTGNDFNFDPWHPASESNLSALEKWKNWSENKKNSGKTFVSFSKEQCIDLLRQALSDTNQMRAVRAKHLLRRAGKAAFEVIDDYIKKNKNLPENQIRKIKELQYTLCIPDDYKKDPGTLAHKIVFGKLDSRLNAIEELKHIGKPVFPIIRDLLNDSSPLVRESAGGFLSLIPPETSVPIIRKMLQKEKDEDVIFAMLRTLSFYEKSKDAQKLLATYLKSENEDLIIAALDGLSKGQYKLSVKILEKLMTDSRWRVRAAAVNYVNKTSNKNGIEYLKKLVKDKDEFVRTKALLTLAKLSDEEASEMLEKIFFNDDSMKITVIKCYAEMDKKIPDNLINALKKCDDKILIGLTGLLLDKDRILLPLAAMMAEKNNPDLKIPALVLLADSLSVTSPPEYIEIISNALKKNNPDEVLPVLKNLKSIHNESDANIFLDDNTNDTELEDLLSSFDDSSDITQNSNGKSETDDVTGLFDAFENSSTNKKHSVSLNTVYKNIINVFEKSTDKNIKLYAAVILCRINKNRYEKFLINNFSDAPKEIQLNILEKIYHLKTYTILSDFFFKALKSDDPNIQKAAASLILYSKKDKSILKLLNLIEHSDIKPFMLAELMISSIRDSESNNKIKKLVLNWLKNNKEKTDLLIFAGIIFGQSPYYKAIPYLKKYIYSKNKYLRRAVYFAIFRHKKTPDDEIIKAIQKEKDPFVKQAFTTAYLIKTSSTSIIWYNYFDDKHFFKNYIYSPSGVKLNKKIIAVLKNFTESEDLNSSFNAYLTLLYAHKKIDLNKFYELASALPDSNGVSEQITNFFEENYSSLGQNFTILLPFVDKSSYNYKEILKHFHISTEKNNDITFAQFNPSEEVNAEFISDNRKKVSETNNGKKSLTLIFFEKKGCRDCMRVKKLLEKVKKIFSNLKIQKYDIDKVNAMRLNETYCGKFNVPNKYRLVAPALFAGAGYLIKNDITEPDLVRLLADSISIPSDKWYIVTKNEIKKSSERIEKRYQKTNIWLILLAGLLDGVNPCAFATIIFFISYLRIRRKNTKEIILVGISFISAVFLSYFAFGMGLNQIIVKFYKFDIFRLWFNRAMALFVLIIMIMSIYDAFLCMKGNIENISLQLPDFIKEKIRSTIRTGSSNTHYVIAAFIMGCIISFLELGCTGQVYAPMIAYMWQTGIDYYGSIVCLTAYNTAFIVPLVIIFAAVVFGLKNDTLNNFFHKHAALVKFSTALLFLLLLISICYYNPDILKF